MLPHEERVVDELAELNEKRVRLAAFMETEKFESLSFMDANRLRRQASIMEDYAHVLEDRILFFPKQKGQSA